MGGHYSRSFRCLPVAGGRRGQGLPQNAVRGEIRTMSPRKSLKNRVRRQVLGATLALAALACAPVVAQGFPDEPVRLPGRFPPGGGTAVVAPMCAEQRSTFWHQALVAEEEA